MKKLFVMLFFFLIPVIVLPQDKQDIDTWLEECLKETVMEEDRAICYQDAEEKWDKELNVVYQKLIKLMGKDEKAVMEASQKIWIIWRDNEFKMLDLIFGMPYRIIIKRLDIVKTRAVNLSNLLYFYEHNY